MKLIIPKSKTCFCCGTDNPIGLDLTYYFEDGKVFTSFIPDKKYGVSEAVLHPGVAFGIIVEVMGWIPACTLKHLTVVVESTIKVLSPAPIGKRLNVIAESLTTNHWLSEVQGVLKDDEGNIYYRATAKYIIVSSKYAPVADHCMENSTLFPSYN